MKFQSTFRRAATGLVGAFLFGVTMVMPTMAADPSVTQVITSNGTLTASVADANMQSIAYSNSVGSTTGTLVLSVSDPRGTSVGWSVSIQASDFVWSSSANSVNPNAHDIPSTGFEITGTNAVTKTAGQNVDSTHGPISLSAAVASLDQARTTIKAEAGFGSGNYEQQIPVSLRIPAMSQEGTYVSTLTVLTSLAP